MCVKISADRFRDCQAVTANVAMSVGISRSCQDVKCVSKFPLTDAAVSECLLALIEVVKALPMYTNFH